MKPYPEHPDETLVRRPLASGQIDTFLRHDSWFVRQECLLYQARLKTISTSQLLWAIDNDSHPLNRRLARALLQEMPRLPDLDDEGPASGPDN